ncbi:hypothetical protein CCAX7_55800 [Capsulimonas corticalis]|uniref:Uncharacterized protein n=1 Tax=Capsulimonas corticalis TaxID=2219043 RepID=A0A402D0T3_9BACT|nr:alpha/beta hydrolase [Capsulimonas corticalis]BDI33529.1 hypothetical protein CCAX7_55800 [Capsulimonas corticalis]
MDTSVHGNQSLPQAWSVVHPISDKDAAAVAAMRAELGSIKGVLEGIAARPIFDDVMGRVLAPDAVTYEQDTVGGVPGWWCRPAAARPSSAILYLHGGWYSLGSALAYRNFAGQFAARAGADTFVPDYRLTPEHPFPAGLLDAEASWNGLVARGMTRIAIAGDSAGGGLTLSLLSRFAARPAGGVVPVGAVVLSPLTDVALTGASWETRAEADPYFTLAQSVGYARLFLGDHDPKDPLASPLYGDLAGLPPIRVHVGDDETLLDDSRRYAERAVSAGVDVRLDIWTGLPHVFQSSVGALDAAGASLDMLGAFLAERLTPPSLGADVDHIPTQRKSD